MSPRHRLLTILVAALTVSVACVTINVYFPEEKVQEISQQIEDAVERQAAEGTATEEEPAGNAGSEGRQVWLPARLGGWLDGTTVLAQEVAAPEISSPAIRKIIQSRGARVQEINRFKSQGVLGENRKALLEVRDLESLELRQRATVQRLVKAENRDRQEMFREIAAATGVDPSQLPRIQETYAETLRQKARSGDWIQQADGRWVRKS